MFCYSPHLLLNATSVKMYRTTFQRLCTFMLLSLLLFVDEVEVSDKSESGGLQVHIEHKPINCNEESAVGDKVTIHYTGTLDNGQVFDSSIKKQRDPISLTLGAGQVIEGWEKGLLQMCVGEKRRLVIPPSMGYGDAGFPPVIPGGATLHFEVSMESLEKGTQGSLTSSSDVIRVLSLPSFVVGVVLFLYFRYKQEMEASKGEKKKSKKRR